MAGEQQHLIATRDQLRELYGEPHEATREKVYDHLDEQARGFIERSPMLLMATVDQDGMPSVSPKGDPPGFVEVVDEKTLLIPDRKGNKLLFGLESLIDQPRAGLIFLIPGTEETLRVQCRCELTVEPAVLEQLEARGDAALLAIRAHVESAYFHCAKAFRRSGLWQPDLWSERFRVSFGKQYAQRKGLGDEVAAQIDEAVQDSYRTQL